MNLPFSPLSLAAVFTLSLFLSVLNYAFWLIKREDRTPLWLAAWLAGSTVFALCRLLQYASLSEQAYMILPRILLTSAYFLAWMGYEIANYFIHYRPRRGEQMLVRSLVGALILLLWASDLILTDRVVLRTVPYGGEFHGVMTGPFYLQANLLNLVVGIIPLVRLLGASSRPSRQQSRMMALGYFLIILFSLIDFWSTSRNLNWIRLSDYNYLPMAVFFTYIQVQQIRWLYRELDLRVHERTTELRRANITLRASEEQARLSEHRLMGLVNSAMDAVINVNSDQKIVLFNPAAERLFGYQAGEILGQPLAVVLPERYHISHKQQIQEFARTGITARRMHGHGEITGLRKDGSEISLEASISQVEVGEEKVFTAILRDISDRKQAEQALQRQLKEMIALNSVATAGAKATDIDELIQSVTHVIARMVYPDNCGILLASEDLKTFRPHPSYQGIDLERTNQIYSISEGVVGKVIASGQLIRINDVHQESAYMEVTPGIRSEVCVPVFVDGKVFGCLNAESREPNAFTEHDERLLSTVADSLATAIEKIQLLQTEKRRREEVEILYNTTRNLVIERDLAKLLQTIVEKAVVMMAASGGGLYLAEPEQRQLRCVVSYNTTHDYSGTVLRYGEGAAGRVAETGQPLIVEDYHTWEGRAAAFERDESLISILSVPMRWQGLVIGVLDILENKKLRAFTEEDVQIIRHFANHAAIAVQNARLFETEQRRRQQAEILREATLSLTYSMELETLYSVILATVERLIPYDGASIELVDEGYFEMVAVRNLPNAEHVLGARYLYSEEHWGDLEKIRGPVIAADVREDERFVKLKGSEYIRGWMGIPLFARDKLIGFLNLYSRTIGFYAESYAAIAQTFGSQAAIAIDNALLLNDLQNSNTELVLAYDTTLEGWAKALELRDKETEGHSRRVTDLTLYLAQKFGITGSALTHIRRGVLLHDIGKMGVPDQILKKAGTLTSEEWNEMRKHPQYAYDLLYPISYLRPALDIPYCHHERWDGNGYPRGLRGEQIPLAARIFTVIDVWDALSHNRSYRDAWPQDKIISYLKEQSGLLFDPIIVQEFLNTIDTQHIKLI